MTVVNFSSNSTLDTTRTDLITVRPKLLLDFSNSTVLDPRITFTRSSGATRINARGLVETVGTNTPRFDYDPVTLACKGLLIEEQRTNLLTPSEAMNTSPWGVAAATAVADAAVAPDGNTTADKVISTGGGVFRAGVGIANATAYTYSVFLKYVAGTGVVSLVGFERFGATPLAGNSSFNLLTGAVVSNGTNVQSSSITRYPNNWFRVSITATSTDVTATVVNYAGTSGNEFLIWGAQLEAGAFPTSYIPTTTAEVTRAADVAVIQGANFSSWYNQSEGTLYADASVLSTSYNQGVLVDIGAVGTFGTTEYISWASTAWRLGPSVAPINVSSSVATASTAKIAAAIKANDSVISANGLVGTVDTTCAVPLAPTTLSIGKAGWSVASNFLNGHIARIAYYNRRLSNVQIQQLTS